MKFDVVVVDIIESVVNDMEVSDGAGGFLAINYEPGRVIQIVKSLIDDDNSITLKGTKYPLIALYLPIREVREEDGFYAKVRIEKIVIATIADQNKSVINRYASGDTFKSVLYPCYYEFLKRLSMNQNVNMGDPNAFSHTKLDNPGVQENPEINDFIDCIEIQNLEFTLTQLKNCQ